MKNVHSKTFGFALAQVLLATVLIFNFSPAAFAQCSLSDYAFTRSTGTFTPISGSTKLPVVVADDASSTAQPIGFQFFYAGRVYDNFYMNSNGYVALVNGVNTPSPVAANIRNTNNSNNFGNNPILFPLFGDLAAVTTPTPAGDASYILEGTAPNRVLTIQWLNWKWGWSATAPSVSFQAKIYEGTNKIEYVYKPGSVAPNLPVSIGMSAPTAANAASYLSANTLSTTATVSGSTFTTSIQPASVVDGLTYTFTPPVHAVTITQQPSAGAVFNSGDSPITITAAATASSALSYQWQQSADNGITWTNVSNNATFSNATTASMSITNPASTLHKYLYRCQITAASSSCPNYTSNFTLGIYQGYTVINDLGGVAASPLNDLRISIGAGGQIQVKRNSQNQVFDPAYANAATTPVTRLFNGVFLTVGTTVFGPSNTPATNATTVTPFVTVSHTGGSMTGDGRDVLVLKATKASKDYLITLTYDYVYPNSYFNIQYKVDVPAGNTDRVKIYHLIDTYLQGGDAGPAYIQGRPPYILMGVSKAPSFEAFRYVSGLVWTGYYSSLYSGMYSSYLKTQTNFDNILNYTATTDNGIGWMYDFGASTAAGSYDFSSDLVFELPPLPTITTQPTNIVACPNTTVTFTTATSTPNALFQWQVSTNGGTTFTDVADNGTYSGSTAASLVVLPTSAMSTYKYRCIIYTAPGWNASYTNAATLTVNPVTTAGTPTVTLTTFNYCRNNSYDLTVTNPVNAMTYIWKKEGTIISSAASATYSTTQTGVYSVQFSPSGFCPGASSTPITVVANVICTDTDGDGVNDALDIDDDNDGVLDTMEQYCSTMGVLTDIYGPTYWKSIAWTGGAYLAQYSYATPDLYIDGVLNNGVEVFRPGTVASPIAGDDFTATPIIFTLELQNPMHADGFSIVNDYGAAGDNILKADIKLFSGTGSNTILLGTETVDNMADVASTTRYPFSKGYDNINTIQIVVYKTLPGGTQAANGMQMGELGLYSNPGTFCNDFDTDGDGIPNRLDLDSDGDGCPDALEAGIPTAILTSATVVNLVGSSLASGTVSSTLNNAVVATVGAASATFGNNGFANAVETASESGIYSGTYTYQYAKWKSYASCLDTDGDGIPDITDIDDDNDGILDAVESPDCFSTITDAVYIGAITSSLTQYSTYAIGQSIDQNTSTASAFSTGQNWVGQEIFRMTPAINGALKISGIQFDLLNWGLSSATTSTFKLQGSNNAGSSWTDLSVATYSTATTGNFTINNTLQTATAYSLYRLVGVAGTSGYGGVTEIRLIPTSDYIPSMHQIYTCTLLDTDGDGIPNTIDLDSDGDGCPDAKETGIIGTLTAGTISNMVNGVVVRNNNNIANTIASGAYGANGFANALETSSETGIYTSTYYYDYAITATLNACTDSDGDGVPDLIDLDNDNDGILDAVESPTCFFSLTELTKPNDVSSDLTPYSTYVIGQSIDGSATTTSAFATGQNWVGKEIFKFTANNYIAVSGMSLDLTTWALSSAAASTFKLQGSSDNSNWLDLSTATFSTATTGTLTIANTLASTTKFKYFRLIGVAGTSGYGGVSEARFNLIASTNASANPKSTCNNDTDGDGIFNQNDLDSDGDGCPDAIEAGTAVVGTTAFGSNSFFNPATTGANGFANSLETATESGIYSGTYKYIRALSSAISACLDSDGDGIPNIDDIDDDNDGVLDISEMNCTPVATKATCLATPQAFGITTHCSGWNGFDYDPSPSVTIISNFDYMGLTSGIPYFDFQGSVNSSATTQLCGKMYKNYTTIPGMTYTFSVNLMSSFVDAEGIKPYLKGVDGTTGYELGATYLNGTGVRSVTFTAIGTTTTITLGLDTRTSLSYAGGNQFWHEVGFTMNGSTYQTCTIADTDNDGIPNYLDVDSDGDGCPDAVEAQTTYVSTSGVASSAKLTTSIIPGPYGTNGFANGLETVTDNGIYTSTYTYNYATDATINACTDTDGDGIPDAIDLDDDNDGILDTIEENCTVSVTSKTGLIITKPSTINYTFNSNTINNLIDGVDNNVYVTSAPTGTLSNSPWFNFQFPTPKTLTYLEIGHYSGQYLFATTSTYKIQGSNDNSTWNDVTGTLTYNNIATSTSGGLSTNNSNIANFPSNRTAYTYYRIYGLAATAGAGWATEIYFKETNCFTDVDGDGIPNKLDTDSDGDGCPDAVEAGTTYISTSGVTGTARLTTSVIPAPYGANGFANGLETTTESGIYTGSYSYGYALDATINVCTDTDGDGVPDILDLDDDNDGVLDTVECPASATYTLYTYNYPATTIASNVPVNITGMSSQDVLLDQRTNGVAPNAFTYNSITNWKLVASNIKPSAANTITVKIAPTASTTATYVFADAMLITNGVNTYVIDNNATNTGGFNLTGTWTQQTGGYANTNSYLTSPSYAGNTATWTFSNIPVPTVCDTDGDGIPNSLDLDSDGDGCPDAVEAGTTYISTSGVTGTARLTTSVISAPYGANGFANGLETTTESGLYTGTYTYNYALDATINACTDTDGDAVPDILDLDDDNDGVLDSGECSYNQIFLENFETATVNPYKSSPLYQPGVSLNGQLVAGGANGTAKTLFNNTGAGAYAAGDIIWGNKTSITVIPNRSYKISYFMKDQNGVSFPQIETWVNGIKINNAVTITTSWVKYTYTWNSGINTKLDLTLVNLNFAGAGNDFYLDEISVAENCVDIDTDNDGIPNRLDLDSDGDGCPDAKEAGVTGTLLSGSVKNGTGGAVTSTTLTQNAVANGPYGNNGLANGLEATTESGVTTYTSTYAANALVADTTPPTITAQPVNKTVFVGGALALSVTATPPTGKTLTYQWYKDGVAVSGATTAAYTISNAASTANAGDYYCVVGIVNSCQSISTNTVNVTVLTNPASSTICLDGNVSFSVTKTGTNVVTYQWKKNNTNITGATAATLVLTNAQLADAGAYTCEVRDVSGATSISSAGTLTVTNNTKYTLVDYTTCAINSTYSLTGNLVIGTAGATSTKWQRSTDGGATWVDVASSLDGITYSNFTTNVLTLSSVPTGLNGYRYRIVTTNGVCSNYSNVDKLTVTGPPAIVTQPSNSTLCTTTGTSFSVVATGTGLTYQWQRRTSSAGTWTNVTTSLDAGIYTNVNSATLVLTSAPASAANYEYQVIVTSGSCGSVTSTVAVLNPTLAAPTISGGNVTVCEGTPVTLTASGASTYQWFLNGTAIGGATGSTFAPSTSGNYSVQASATGYCSAGSATSTVTISALPTVSIAEGTTLTLTGGSEQLTATASPAGTYTYTWYDGANIVGGPSSNNVFNVTATGSYTVKATNAASCFATSGAIVISSLPSAQANGATTFCEGGSVVLTTTMAAGADGVQWLKNGTTVVGAGLTYTATTSGSYAAQFLSNGVPITAPNTTTATNVTVNPLPTATLTSSTSAAVCAGTSIGLTAISNAVSPTFAWYKNGSLIAGATAGTYSATTSGDYSFAVTNGSTTCANSSTATTVTIVSPPAAPNLTATSANICVNTTADLTLYKPVALAGILYEWHTTSSNPTNSTLVGNPSAVSTAGTYYLYAKNATAGCYSPASLAFTLTVTAVAQPTLTAASAPTYTVGDFAVPLNASTTVPSYSIRWYANATGGVALAAPVLPSTTVAGVTTYYVDQYDAASSFCSSSPRLATNVTVKPLAPSVADLVYCQNASAIALTANPAIGGILNWYGLSASGGISSTTAPTPVTSGLSTQTYYVSQTVNGVESDRAGITVTINAATAQTSVISGATSVTALSSETYAVTSVANTTYAWTLPSFMSGTSITNSITASIDRAGSGLVSVVATDATGCPSMARSTNVITAQPFITPDPTTTNATYSIGDPAIPANTNDRVTAANGATLNFYSSASGASSASQAMPTTAGVYTYYVSQTINGVESNLVPYTITIKPLAPVVADVTYCQNATALALTATGSTLKWYATAVTNTFTTTAPTPSTGTATVTAYYVTQTIGGAESDRIAINVTVNPTPSTPSAIAGATAPLASASETYSVTAVANTTYNWTLPATWTGTSSTNSMAATVGTSGGVISVQAVIGSCTSPASTLVVTITGVTNPPVSSNVTFVTGSVPSNIATNTTALITAANGATLNFYSSNASGTASTTSQATPTTPGVYTYYVSQSINGIESVLVPYTVTVKPVAPDVSTNFGINGNTIAYCKNASSIALTATGTSLLYYTVASGGSGTTTAPTPSTGTVGSTNYYVSQTVNGVESDRALIIVKVNDLPSAAIASANSQPTCTNTFGSILITAPLGTGYTYSADGLTYVASTTFSPLPAGTYNVTAKNADGCISAPASVVINAAPVPPLAPVAAETQPTCTNRKGTITVTVVNNTDTYSIDGLSYQSSPIFNNVAPGTYSVTVQSASGCVSAASTSVINAAPAIPAQAAIASTASGIVCAGTAVTLTSSAATGNQWYKDGVLISGAVQQTFQPLASGSYTVLVTNAFGCTGIASLPEAVTFQAIPVATISEGAQLAFNNCTNSTIVLTALNATTANGNTYQWYLNGNAINVNGTSSTYNATQAGNYAVVITNNGCSSTSPFTKIISAPSVNAANTAICVGGSTVISGINTGFNSPVYQWEFSADGTSWTNASGTSNALTYTATAAGQYHLKVTDGSTVSISCPIIITQFTPPAVSLTASAAACVGATTTLTAVATGTPSFTYQWSLSGGNIIPGATLSTYTTGIAGTYALVVTDANGCSTTATPTAITFNALPVAPTVVVTDPTCSVSTGTISVTAPLGTNYLYSLDGGAYQVSPVFTGVASGSHSVTAKTTEGCEGPATSATVGAALVVPAQPAPITGPIAVGLNSLNTYSVSPVAGATSYTWTVPGGWSGVSTTNTIVIKVDQSSGTISVVANSATCSGPARTLAISTTSTTPDINVTNANVPVSGNLTTNDAVPTGRTYGQPVPVTGATITVSASGTYTFTSSIPGKYVFNIPVCAPGQTTNCPTTPLEITVLDPIPATDRPVANNDIASVTSGVPARVNILANDAAGNPGGTLNPASVTITSNPAHGSVVVNSDGTITFTPVAGYVGTDQVTYQICDNSVPALCQTAVVYFTVSAPAAPLHTTAVDDYASVTASPKGTNSVSGNVLSNDTNSAGGTLSATLVSGPSAAKGVFTLNANGSYTFTPSPGFSGPVDIVYTACAGSVCETATLHILVDPAPVITPDFNVTDLNVPVAGKLGTNDVVPAGTTYGQPAAQAGATLVVNPDGSYTFTGTVPGKYVYNVPVCPPGQTTNCPTMPLEITVIDPSILNKPVANNDVAKLPAGGTTTTNVLANDKAANPATSLVASSVAITVQPLHGTVTVDPVTGALTYTPTAGYVGTDVLTYSVCDNATPAQCQTATVSYTVTPATAPASTTANDDFAKTPAGAAITGGVLTNDSNTAGANLTASLVTGPTSAQGTFTLAANGTYTFTPAPGFSGPVDIVYQACAAAGVCSKATLHILVDPAPVITPDFNVTDLNVPVAGKLGTNDVVPAGTTYGQPAAQTGATLVVNPDGSYTFTGTVPGKYVYDVPVCPPGQTTNCPTSPLEITVIDPMSATNLPVANNDVATLPAGGSTTTNVLANDKAANGGTSLDPASVTITAQPANGTAIVNSDGTITYTPAPGFVGTDVLTYQVCDNSSPALCQTATVSYTVTPANALPSTTANDDFAKLAPGTSVSGNVLTNDSNTAGASLTASVVSGPTSAQGTFTMNANGSYSFTPTAGFSGPVDIVYQACTAAGVCSKATLHILVDPAPVLVNDTATGFANVPVSGNLSTNDTNVAPGTTYGQPAALTGATIQVGPSGTYTFTATAAGTYTYTIPVCAPGQTVNCPTETLVITVTAPTVLPDVATAFIAIPSTGDLSTNDTNPIGTTYGTPVAGGNNPTGAVLTVSTTGTYTFTAANPGTYTFAVPVCAVGQTTNCPVNTLTITVASSPTVTPDFNVTDLNVPVAGKLATNDVIPPGTTYGQPAAQAGATLVVNPDGSYTFTGTVPGKYVYDVPVCPPGQTTNCPTTPLEITVIDPSSSTNKPVANNDVATLPSGGSTTTNVLANDKAANAGTSLVASSLAITAQPSNGTAVVNPDGTITYTPAAGFVGTDVLTYQVCDNSSPALCQTATVSYTVTPANALPSTIANDDFAKTAPGTTVSGNVLTNDSNTAGVSLTASVVSGPTSAQGTFTLNANGSYSFTPTAGFSGPVDIVYEACTSAGACTKATLHILVDPAPVLVNDIASAFANVPKTGNVSTNDVIPTGSTYGQPAAITGATITVAANGTYTFTATAAGTYTYTIPVCAPGQTSNCPTETLVITVTTPTPVDDAATAFANVPTTGNVSTNDSNPAGTTFGQPTQETGATITVAANGTYTFTATVAGTYTYTIPVCAPGQTSNCPTETLVITVTAPGPVDDTATALANVPASGNIATNDSNPAGTTFGQPTALTGATITVAANGTYTFTATVAGTYTYTIPVCAPGQTSNCPTETLVITVTAPGPVNDTATALANVPASGNIATNDSNPAGTTFGQPAAISGATITVNADGTYSFMATAAGTYTYTIPVCAPGQTSNCPTETLVITVTEPSVPPTPPVVPPVPQPVNDTASTTKNTAITGNVATNDNNPAGTTFGQPAAISGATITVNPDGTYSFTATAAGTYTYTIPVCAPGQTSNCPTETLAITVTDPTVPYTAPTTNPDIDATNINVPVSGNVSTNDAPGATYGQPAQQSGATITVNANGTYSFSATIPGVYTYLVPACPTGQTTNCPTVPLVITVSDPLKDSNSPVANTDVATVNAGSSVTTKVLANDKAANPAASLNPASLAIVTNAANGTAVLNADGTITYTPKAGFTGVDEITYKICDNSTPALCSTAKVVYTIQPVTEPAKTFAADDYNSTPAGSAVTGSVLSNDGNTAGETLTATIVSGVSAAEGTLVFNANGTYTFTPAPGFSGPVDVVYTVCSASNVCAKATLHLVVNPPEILTPDFNATLIGIPVNGSVATNDVVPAGSTYGQPASISRATIRMNPDGTYSFSSTTPGTYEYLVPVCTKAQTTNCPLIPLVITVSDPNAITNPPIANADVVSVASGSPVTTNVLANDQAANQGGVLVYSTLAITNAPVNGTAKVNTDGTITYTPKPGFVGTDVLTYTICDNSQPALCKTAKVYYTVGATASKNVLASDDYAISQGGMVSGNVLGNDKSSTGSALSASVISNVDAAKGSFSLSPSGAYTFTPASGYVGPVDIVYSVCSADGKCTQATLHITVLPVPDMIAPQAITPNGDGKNDTLIFRGLPALNIENRLTIYNRWGNIVFSTGNYQNNWSGQTDNAFGAMATDNKLPDGTYYYILDFLGARPNLGNYVYLDRSSN